jgi:uncharacterized protein YbjT (DUF2867 family)
MDRSDKLIVVAGATGHQGGASARHLLEDGWRVRAITRDPEQPEARGLMELGAEVERADLLDRKSIDRAVEGAYGVFSVETAREGGPEAEYTEGKNLADAALDAGVRHFVYNSVIGVAHQGDTAPWIVSKTRLEAYVKGLGMRYTIWRPVTFMEDFLRHREQIGNGLLQGPEPGEALHQYIAVDDIGRFVALAFADRDAWEGQTTPIAGEILKMVDVANAFTKAIGRPVTYQQVPPPSGAPAPSGPIEFADIAVLRTYIPDLKTLEQWASGIYWGEPSPMPAGERYHHRV